jgi:hypothetical protein
LVAVVTAANFAAEGLLLHYLLKGGGSGGRTLVFSAAQIWLTNVAVFGLWFWEVDRGAPHRRTAPEPRVPDFLLPRMPRFKRRAGAQSARPRTPLLLKHVDQCSPHWSRRTPFEIKSAPFGVPC